MRPTKKKRHINPRYFLHEQFDGMDDAFDDLDKPEVPPDPKCESRPSEQEAGEWARAAMEAQDKAMETSKDPSVITSAMAPWCVDAVRPIGRGRHIVTFHNGLATEI